MSMRTDAVYLAIGWTMLHFLWVGGLIGILAAIVLRSLRGAAPGRRYGFALGALALLAAAPAAIGWRVALLVGSDPMARESGIRPSPVMPTAPAPRIVEAPVPVAPAEPAGRSVGPVPIAAPARVVLASPSWSFATLLDAIASRLAWLWLVGSPITFAWLALGMAGAERLRRQGVRSVGELSERCGRLARELGLARDVAVAVCERLAAPVLVGVVRPLILLPAAALGGWGPEQIEMVLLHELAHVRRWDNLVNLLQRLVESALFFHPAVWIVSGWVRREREHCCDAMVVARTGRARAYAETLLALSDAGPARTPRAAVAMAGNDLVSRIRRILDQDPQEHAMKLPHGLLALTAAIVILPAGWTIARGPLAGPPADPRAQEKPGPKNEPQSTRPAGGHPAVIQGKSVDEWLAALKDRDPADRLRAVEILGERSLDPAIPADEKSRLQIAVSSLLFSDKDEEVRQAAAFFEHLRWNSRSPEMVKRALEARKRIVKPTRMSIRLVDVRGQPVAGAVAGTYFWRDADHDRSFRPSDPKEAATSDAQGELALKLGIPGHLDGTAVYAIRQDGDHPLVGLHKVTRGKIRGGKPVTVVMHPACRVRLRVECPGFRELAEKYHADVGGADWARAAYVWLGQTHEAPRPLYTESRTGELEFLLPPGRFMIDAYGDEANNAERVIEIKPGHRLLSLGVIEVSPTSAVKEGFFRGRWRSIRRDARADRKQQAEDEHVVFRLPRWGVRLKSEARQVQDIAYSPDGRLLATAHWYNADPGELKLWDAATGDLVASLPVPVKEGGVLELAFSPDGKLLAGSVGVLPNPQPPGVIVLWDVASRRELRTLRGHAARITTLAFAPDGRTLASGGEDRTVRFWNVASGREAGRVDGNPGWVRSVAYSPDGKTLAIGSGPALKLWDVVGNRPGATLEPVGFLVQSVTFAPDGRTLAAGGTVVGPGGQGGTGSVFLYDMTQSPPARRAELGLHRAGPGRQNEFVSDIAFTPDGRRVAGVMMNMLVVWDAATGDQQASLDRSIGTSADRLAVSPDGRWLAALEIGLGGAIRTYDISPPGP